MTRNLYLGADLSPALVARDTPTFLEAVAGVYAASRETKFEIRAEAIADEIKTKDPDLIGLQEVSRWKTSAPPFPQMRTSSQCCSRSSPLEA